MNVRWCTQLATCILHSDMHKPLGWHDFSPHTAAAWALSSISYGHTCNVALTSIGKRNYQVAICIISKYMKGKQSICTAINWWYSLLKKVAHHTFLHVTVFSGFLSLSLWHVQLDVHMTPFSLHRHMFSSLHFKGEVAWQLQWNDGAGMAETPLITFVSAIGGDRRVFSSSSLWERLIVDGCGKNYAPKGLPPRPLYI